MKPEDPKSEGHTREWQDRARVVLDAKEAVKENSSDKQSPVSTDKVDDVEEKSRNLDESRQDQSDSVY